MMSLFLASGHVFTQHCETFTVSMLVSSSRYTAISLGLLVIVSAKVNNSRLHMKHTYDHYTVASNSA